MKAALLLSAALALVAGAASADAEKPLAGKTIGITSIRADNQADRLFYQSAVAEVEALGGKVIGLDAQSNDQTQIAHIQTLIAQKPDAVIEIRSCPRWRCCSSDNRRSGCSPGAASRSISASGPMPMCWAPSGARASLVSRRRSGSSSPSWRWPGW
jgi:hypothetical protein